MQDNTKTNNQQALPDRSLWVAALSAIPFSDLQSLVKQLTKHYTVCNKSVPQAGLGMLKIQEGAFQEAFNLGEFPVSFAWIELTAQNGETFEGAAQIMDDSIERATTLALADAILANRLPDWEQLAEQVNTGMQLRENIRQKRKAMLAQTQVDFSLLDATGNMGSE